MVKSSTVTDVELIWALTLSWLRSSTAKILMAQSEFHCLFFTSAMCNLKLAKTVSYENSVTVCKIGIGYSCVVLTDLTQLM